MAKITLILLISIGYLCTAIDAVEKNFKVVTTEHGPIRGELTSTIIDQKPFYSFRGIPYAQPPLGELRFKPPKPPIPWTEPRDALSFGNNCIQKSTLITNKVHGDEDCLFLNVYVPANSSNVKLPVMVFIHGGAHSFGSGDDYGPDFLLNNDVILVTLNFRLGPLGFLSLDTPEYSGNMGLKDQLAAIKWVNRNIENFGGDSQKITIVGSSTGSVAVELHTISSANTGLFQRAIFQSGSVLCPFAMGKSHVETMYTSGKKFGNDLKTVDEIIQFLNLVDAHLLVTGLMENTIKTDPAHRHPIHVWGPVVEVPNAIEPFLLNEPLELLQNKSTSNVDIMTGYNTEEGYIVTLEDYNNPARLQAFDETFDIMMPWKDWKPLYGTPEYTQAANEIRNFYIPGGKVNLSTFSEFSKILSDSLFVYGIGKSASLHAKRTQGKVFNYVFDMDTKLNFHKTGFGQMNTNLPGAAHADELSYLFYFGNDNFKYPELYLNLTEDSNELKGIRLMTKLWTNFAKFGTPTIANDTSDVLPITENQHNFVTITNEGLVRGLNSIDGKIKFWDSLYEKYNAPLVIIPTSIEQKIEIPEENLEMLTKAEKKRLKKNKKKLENMEENQKTLESVDKKKDKRNKNNVDTAATEKLESEKLDKKKQRKNKETESEQIKSESAAKVDKKKQKRNKGKVEANEKNNEKNNEKADTGKENSESNQKAEKKKGSKKKSSKSSKSGKDEL